MPLKYELLWRKKSGWVYGSKDTAAGMSDMPNTTQSFTGF